MNKFPKNFKISLIIGLIAVYCGCSGLISSGMAGDILPTPSLTFTLTSTLTPTTTHTITTTPTLTFTPTSTYTYTWTPSLTPIPSFTFTPSPTITMPLSTSMQCIPRDYFETGTVTKITDGDTIRVTINGINYPVRLIGIDAPELATSENNAQEGILYLQNLILNKNITLYKDQSETDRYDRLLRYVVIGNTFVNYELVRLGYAKSVPYYPDTACNPTFNTAQTYAENNLQGMWVPTLVSRSSGITIDPNPNCSPYYPDVCIAPYPPDLNCKDIPYRRFKVLPPDPHNFDGDGDGIGCESN